MNEARRILFVLLAGLFALFVQGTLLKALFPSWVMPNIALTLVVFLAFYEISPLGAFLAFLLGLELDMYGGVLLGPWAGAFTTVFALFAFLSQRLFVDTPVAAALISFVACALADMIYLVLVYEVRPFESGMLSIVLLESFLTALCAPLVIRVMRQLGTRFERGARSSVVY